MIARIGIIDNYDKEKKRVTLIWEETKNRSLPLLMLKRIPDNTEIVDYETGKTKTPVELPEGEGVLELIKDPAVPIIGKRAVAVMLDDAGHGVYIGMIWE